MISFQSLIGRLKTVGAEDAVRQLGRVFQSLIGRLKTFGFGFAEVGEVGECFNPS